MITELTIDRIDEVSNAQISLVPDSYWSRLGKEFLRIYYREIINSKQAYGFIFLHQNKVAGYITAAKNTYVLMRDIVKNNIFKISKIYLSTLFTNPFVFIDGIKFALFVLLDKNERNNNITGGITSFGVLPEFRSLSFFKNNKIQVSEKLFDHCIKCLKENDVSVIRADTMSDNISINNFYKRAGFKVIYSYRIGIFKYKKNACSYVQVLNINDYKNREEL